MGNTPLSYNNTTKASIDAQTVLLNSGFIDIYSGTQPAINGAVTGTKIVRLSFSATAFAASTATGTGGSAAANTITSGTAIATATAGYFVLLKTDGTTIVGSGSCGLTSGFDLNLTATAINTGDTVSCSSFNWTQPQS
jgi:hypothetical protein